jgi:ADP-ribose pyrophosphatase YjhB (NUDIX family)
MRQAARAIVVTNGHLLVIHRNKFGHEYYTLPGGGLKPNESPEHALYRELNEETSISVVNPRLVVVEDAGDPYGVQFVYLCHYVSGQPALHPHSEEAKINALGQNLYNPTWLPLQSLASVPFRSEALRREIMGGLANGFPSQPIVINSSQERIGV